MQTFISCIVLLLCCVLGVKMQWGNEWMSNSISNCPLQPGSSPEEYWHVDQFGRRYLRRCPPGQAFFSHKCACDHSPPPCDFRPSNKGPLYYDQYSNGYWIEMKCATGTMFNAESCGCTW